MAGGRVPESPEVGGTGNGRVPAPAQFAVEFVVHPEQECLDASSVLASVTVFVVTASRPGSNSSRAMVTSESTAACGKLGANVTAASGSLSLAGPGR